jgi:hypothetical protein
MARLQIDIKRIFCNVRLVPNYRVLAAVVFTCAIARPAAADDPPFVIGSQPSWVLLAGVTTGGTIALADKGAFVGGEVSLAVLRDANFAGVYSDAYYDWGANGTYVTAGAELGHKLFGLDGGVALRFANGGTDVGIAGRLTVGIGMVGLYARYMHFVDVMQNEDVVQIGLAIKLPLWTSGGQ